MADILIRFWGVRGTIACPGLKTVQFGGNTACVEVRCGQRMVIFDGGTGLRELGHYLLRESAPVNADIFYSHCHSDHVCGLPFFLPCYSQETFLRLWAGNLTHRDRLDDAISRLMSPPLFPTGMEVIKANLEFRHFSVGSALSPQPGIVLQTKLLNHPGGATGYRLEYKTRSLAYITDTEHSSSGLDKNVLSLAANADIMIYDCNYTECEYRNRAGWGHSTWEQGVRLANAASAKVLVIFHHDPGHDDAFMNAVATEASKARPGTLVAKEGMILQL